MKNDSKILSPKDVIERYPVLGCEGSLANMRCQKRGPKFYKVSRKIVYRQEDIEAYLFRNPIQTIDSMEPVK
jgi:hypothetical protein